MKILNKLLLLIFYLGISSLAMGQGGSTCATATTALQGLNTTGSYTGNGASATSCLPVSMAAINSEWYYFVPTADGSIDISSCDQGQDTRFNVFTGMCGNLTCIGGNDDACPMFTGSSLFASEQTDIPVIAGDTVYIEWDDRWVPASHNWTMDYTYCTASNFDVQIDGFDATVTWTSSNPNAYTFNYGPAGSTDSTQFTSVTGISGTMVTGMPAGIYDFYLIDSCFVNGLSLGATPVGPITVCVPGLSAVFNTAPISESFEDVGCGLSTLWTQSTLDNFDWTQWTGATPSFQTGPSSASDGNSYVYIDVASSFLGDEAILESSMIDVSGLSAPGLRFDYHMFGNDIGTLLVEVIDTGSWTPVWSMTGNQNDQWYTATVSLASFGDTVQIRFIGDDNNPNTLAGGDIALDLFRVQELCSPVMTAPYLENFEEGLTCMINDNLDVLDWDIDIDGTPTNVTGPSSGADSSDYYAYVEASGAFSQGDSAIYLTPSVDISSLTYPELSFDYYMFGADIGSLKVEISDDNGTTWTSLFDTSGDQGEEWRGARFNLTAVGITGNTVQVRFIGVRGESEFSDIAIDNISIDNGFATDLEVTDILTDYPSCLSGVVPISFVVTNYGFMDITTPFDYGVEINGTLLSQVYTGTIGAGQSVTLTLNNGVNLVAGMNEVVYAFSGADFGDEDDTNDFLEDEVVVSDMAVGMGYTSSYEASMDGWYGVNDFEHGVPNGTVINSASDGTDAWITNLDGTHRAYQVSYLYSPCFDFSDFTSDPNVVFDIWWLIESNMDGAWLEISIDGGDTFSKIGGIGTGTNWYNVDVSANSSIGAVWNGDDDPQNTPVQNSSGGWVEASHRVMGTAGEGSVQFRFVMWSDVAEDREGLGIDNFRIEDWCPADLGLDFTAAPSSNGSTADASIAIVASAGTPPYTFQWDANAGNQTTAIASDLMGNSPYTCVVTDVNGCTDTITVTTIVTNIEYIERMTNFDVFPNPTKNTANVIVEFENAMDIDIEIVNVLGQVVMNDRRENTLKSNFSFDVTHLLDGVYMVRVAANGEQTARRLVISK